MRCIGLAGAWMVVALAGVVRAEGGPVYERDIRPILRAHCFHCHGDDGQTKSGLDLRMRRLIVQGGKAGPAIVPGKPADSRMLKFIKSGKMPDEGKPVPAHEIELIERWIAAGAPTASPEPDEGVWPDGITDEDRRFWSFQPIVKPPIPAVQGDSAAGNAIDRFVLAKLQDKGMGPSPQADRRTLIRRACFDLLGLPPGPAEIDAFVADTQPDAYERLIDRLLDSAAYGERWGRHWLDVAGYADSEGYTPQDPERPFAYFYRDYVIRSLNADKPWDRFVTEQLAGDELVAQPWQKLTPEQQDLLAATGFLRMAPDGSASPGTDVKETSNANIVETLKIVSTSLLGLTVGCAQCHTHKYDPIPQTDYYRLRAIFEPALNPAAWHAPAQRLVCIFTEEERKKSAEIEAQAALVDKELAAKGEELVAKVLEKEMAKVPEARRPAVLELRETPMGKRTPEQQALAKEFFNAVNLTVHNLHLYDPAGGQQLDKLREKATAIRKTKPVEPHLMVLSEPINQPPPKTVVFHRGDLNQPKQPVEPGVLSVLKGFKPSAIPIDDPALASTGRRLAFARHLTSGKHPLLARVLVNRFWLNHFGHGLVATPGDFGHTGERPSHPELLDWLAADFMEHGWSLKGLHRLIMTSATYRQSSARRADAEVIDPDNRLLARMPLRRLEAEALRDAVLAVSGELSLKRYGPPVPVAIDQLGQVIPAVEFIDGNGIYQPKRELGGEEFRRSIYIQSRRSRPLTMLEVFDLPAMEPNCELRTRSTVPPQSLMMMNAEFALESAKRFAARLEREAGPDVAAQVTFAWRLALGRAPAPDEISRSVAFLGEQSALIAAQNPPPAPPPGAAPGAQANTTQQREAEMHRMALSTLCQALLGCNEFLYID